MLKSKIFRLFISSTFNDFVNEREILHSIVFPEIARYCAEFGFSFQPVDLRWGVTTEAQLDQKTMSLCLEEVRNCKQFLYPNFLIMVGSRYGYVPCPEYISSNEFLKFEKYLGSCDELITLNYKNTPGTTLVNREITKLALLKQWYNYEANMLDTSGSPTFVLQPRLGGYAIDENWQVNENVLRTILQESAQKIGLSGYEYDKYFLSATEREAIEGIYGYGETQRFQENEDKLLDLQYCYGYLREQNYPIDDRAIAFKERLANTLLPENLIQSSHFADDVIDKLKTSVKNQLESYKNYSELEKEKLEQSSFLTEKLDGFMGRNESLAKIRDYLSNIGTQVKPMVIYGKSGSGKSALVAKSIIDNRDKNIIYRFVGASALSTTKEILASILAESCHENSNNYESAKPTKDYYLRFCKYLAGVKKPTIIFIDGLDQLETKDPLTWLPTTLNKYVRIVISVLNDSKYQDDNHHFRLLLARKNCDFINIDEDSLDICRTELLSSMLKKESRALSATQFNYTMRTWAQTNYSPLYLRLVIQHVKYWSSCNQDFYLNSSIEGVIEDYISDLSSKHHNISGVVERVLGYLVCSKYGLSENELIELLSADLQVDLDFQKSILGIHHKPVRGESGKLSFPLAIWSRLQSHLSPFLAILNVDNNSYIRFFHRQFTRVVNQRIEKQKSYFHNKLVHYFWGYHRETEIWEDRYKYPHMLDELPYQLLASGNRTELKNLLFNLEFMSAVYAYNKHAGYIELVNRISKRYSSFKELSSFLAQCNSLIEQEIKRYPPRKVIFQLAQNCGFKNILYKNANSLVTNGSVNWCWYKKITRKNPSIALSKKLVEKNVKKLKQVVSINSSKILFYNDDLIQCRDLDLGTLYEIKEFSVVHKIIQIKRKTICLADDSIFILKTDGSFEFQNERTSEFLVEVKHQASVILDIVSLANTLVGALVRTRENLVFFHVLDLSLNSLANKCISIIDPEDLQALLFALEDVYEISENLIDEVLLAEAAELISQWENGVQTYVNPCDSETCLNFSTDSDGYVYIRFNKINLYINSDFLQALISSHPIKAVQTNVVAWLKEKNKIQTKLLELCGPKVEGAGKRFLKAYDTDFQDSTEHPDMDNIALHQIYEDVSDSLQQLEAGFNVVESIVKILNRHYVFEGWATSELCDKSAQAMFVRRGEPVALYNKKLDEELEEWGDAIVLDEDWSLFSPYDEDPNVYVLRQNKIVQRIPRKNLNSIHIVSDNIIVLSDEIALFTYSNDLVQSEEQIFYSGNSVEARQLAEQESGLIQHRVNLQRYNHHYAHSELVEKTGGSYVFLDQKHLLKFDGERNIFCFRDDGAFDLSDKFCFINVRTFELGDGEIAVVSDYDSVIIDLEKFSEVKQEEQYFEYSGVTKLEANLYMTWDNLGGVAWLLERDGTLKKEIMLPASVKCKLKRVFRRNDNVVGLSDDGKIILWDKWFEDTCVISDAEQAVAAGFIVFKRYIIIDIEGSTYFWNLFKSFSVNNRFQQRLNRFRLRSLEAWTGFDEAYDKYNGHIITRDYNGNEHYFSLVKGGCDYHIENKLSNMIYSDYLYP